MHERPCQCRECAPTSRVTAYRYPTARVIAPWRRRLKAWWRTRKPHAGERYEGFVESTDPYVKIRALIPAYEAQVLDFGKGPTSFLAMADRHITTRKP